MNLKSFNLKLVIGMIYLGLILITLYFLFSIVDFKDLTSKEIVFVVNKKILDFDFNRTRKELSFARKRITK